MKVPGAEVVLLILLAGLAGCESGRPGNRAAIACAPGPHGGGRDLRAGPLLPSGWFLRQRRGRNGSLPVMARAEALRQSRDRGESATAPGSWRAAGPFNVGGRVTALGLDPNNADHLWLGTAEGGVFASTDSGASWSSLFDDQTALSIGSLAVHPGDSNTIFVGTGEDNGGGLSYDGEGILKTADGGLTWTNLGLAEVRRIGRVAVDPSNPARIYAAAGGDWFNRDLHRGIYRSLDGGASWQKVLFVADDAGGIDVAVDPAAPGRVYAAIWQRQSLGSTWYIGGTESGIYRSLDGGTVWSRLAGGLPSGAGVGRIGLAVSPSSPGTLYALVIDGQGGLLGVYRSADAGDTWALRNASVPLSGFSYYFGNIRVDPADPSVVYLLDQNLWKSTDGGASFTILGVTLHPDWHDLILQGRRMLAGNDAGFFQSKNRGSSWSHDQTLPITQIYDLGVDRLLSRLRLAGAQDTGTLLTPTGGTSDWQEVLSGDGLQCEVDYADSNVLYAEYQYGAIHRSTDGGATLSPAVAGIDPTERTNWNTPLTLDPAVPTTLYTGAQRVYRSTDSALSWNPVSPDLTNGPGAGLDVSRDAHWREGSDHLQDLIEGTVTVVSVSPVDDRILWAGTDDGNVWVSEDAGAAWTRVNPPGSADWVTDIAGDPFDARTAYLTVTGYRQGDKLPYVRATSNLGIDWRDISATLPPVPINSILPDPRWRGRLFAGSDVGVHLSDDGGVSWSALRGGMPTVVVMDLVLDDPSRILYAATYGRSSYSYDLSQLPPADGDGDGVDNNHDCALADPGAFSPPGEAVPLLIGSESGDSETLSWPDLAGSAGPGIVYDAVRGDLAGLATAGTDGAAALACGLSAAASGDPSVPPAGSGFYYLVRGRNSCAAGSWGRNSLGVERVSSACP
jgi:hypothetical protein